MELKSKIYIKNPKGESVLHGHIGIIDEKVCFIRHVKEKDRMRIFDAWSIHPDVLAKVQDKVKGLVYLTTKTMYAIGINDAVLKGFEKSFKGGRTWYISRKHWKSYDRN